MSLLSVPGEGSTPHSGQKKPKILLAVTGCVDASKVTVLWNALYEWADVRVILTETSRRFIDQQSLRQGIPVFIDEHELLIWSKIGDSVLHIECCKWADVLVIAPLSANTLAKIAGGLCDNLLTCIARAWNYDKPVFVAPCMDNTMWSSSLTEKQLLTLDELGVNLIRPSTTGQSETAAMAEPEHISVVVRGALQARFDRSGSYNEPPNKKTKRSSS